MKWSSKHVKLQVFISISEESPEPFDKNHWISGILQLSANVAASVPAAATVGLCCPYKYIHSQTSITKSHMVTHGNTFFSFGEQIQIAAFRNSQKRQAVATPLELNPTYYHAAYVSKGKSKIKPSATQKSLTRQKIMFNFLARVWVIYYFALDCRNVCVTSEYISLHLIKYSL